MLRIVSLNIVYALLFFLVNNLNAQPLEVLLQKASDENLELKILQREYLAALEKAPQIATRPDPEAGIGVFPLPVETRLGAQLVRLSATQMFPWFGVVDAKKEVELAKAKASYERIATSKLNMEFAIKKAWLKLYELQEKEQIVRRNINVMNSLERLALSRMESGKGSATDVLQVQLSLQELEQEILLLQNEKKMPVIEINQLLNRDSETEIVVADTLEFANLIFDKDTLKSQIADQHPMLRMFALQQNVARKMIKVNALNDKPSFGAGLDYILVKKRNDMLPDGNGRDIVQLRAAVKIPIYKEKSEAKEREENLKIDALKLQKENWQSKFLAQLEMAYSEHENARLKLDLYSRQIAVTRSAIQMLEVNYSTNGNKFDELLLQEKALINYDLQILKAIVKSHLAKFKIEKLLSY